MNTYDKYKAITDPDSQRERFFDDDTVTIDDLESENEQLRQELNVCQKIAEFRRIEIEQLKLENAIISAVCDY